jgi:hypothetical protein
MNVAAVQALIRRRGSIIDWSHASPPAATSIDPYLGQPQVALGGVGPPGDAAWGTQGNLAESYAPYVKLRAYFTNKNLNAFWAHYGGVEAGDAELCFALPFEADPANCIFPLSPALYTAYMNGDFAVIRDPAQVTMTFDRFVVDGRRWMAKVRPVPLVDANVRFAWKLLVKADTL